jgi:hypothetical protein
MTKPEEIERLVCGHLEAVSRGEDDSVVHSRNRNRGGLMRGSLPSGEAVVVKFWRIRNAKERLKRFFRVSNGQREWEIHTAVYAVGVPTPKPIGFCRHLTSPTGHFEAMAIADLGETTRVLEYLKTLIEEGSEEAVSQCERALIKITSGLIRMGVVDIDHQLNNFLVDINGGFFRVDFECARQSGWLRSGRKHLVEMLARFLLSHTFVVQPDTDRTISFAERLYEVLAIDRPARALISERVKAMLEVQRLSCGIHSAVVLPL